MHPLVVLSGSSHPELADLVAEGLGLGVSRIALSKFANGETKVKLIDSVRDADVYIIQTSTEPINDMLMELMIIVQACRYAMVHKITVVMPLFFYSRQDRMDDGNQPITAKLVANMLQMAGVNHVISLQLHAPQIQGFFDIPCDNHSMDGIFSAWIVENIPKYQDMVIVTPDLGEVRLASEIGRLLGNDVAIFRKHRQKAGEVSKMVLVGDVRGKSAIIVDDMVDTGGTLCHAALQLQRSGALKIYALVTHGIFTGNAVQKLNDSAFDLVVCTNSVPQSSDLTTNPKFRVINIADMISQSILKLQSTPHTIKQTPPQYCYGSSQ
ncbi:hypothetical protein KR067_003561 [Drosophila pandora]|nr:hypothetical protein KR067_003561 [Drosophila pandora]